jgi:hypothetical protein
VGHYLHALSLLVARPDYNHQFTIAPMRKWISQGVAAPQSTGPMPPFPHLLGVP